MAKAGGSAEYILAMGTSVPLFRMAPAFKGASSLCLLPFLFSSTGNSLNLCFTCSNLYPENNCEACAKVINVDHLSIAVYVKLSQNSCSIYFQYQDVWGRHFPIVESGWHSTFQLTLISSLFFLHHPHVNSNCHSRAIVCFHRCILIVLSHPGITTITHTHTDSPNLPTRVFPVNVNLTPVSSELCSKLLSTTPWSALIFNNVCKLAFHKKLLPWFNLPHCCDLCAAKDICNSNGDCCCLVPLPIDTCFH